VLSRPFDWRDALAVVRPETLIRWQRAGWKLFWLLKSQSVNRSGLNTPRDLLQWATHTQNYGQLSIHTRGVVDVSAGEMRAG
jgi:hypothetical protein